MIKNEEIVHSQRKAIDTLNKKLSRSQAQVAGLEQQNFSLQSTNRKLRTENRRLAELVKKTETRADG